MFKKLFLARKASVLQPQPRWGHSCVAVNNKAILWGGMQAGLPEVHDNELKTKITSKIEVFRIADGKWIQQDTVGSPPLGIRGHACAAASNDIYFFGGFCGHDWCRHNSLYRLDFLTNTWKEMIAQVSATKTPMKKSRCGMFHFEVDGNSYLCVFGGTGLLCSANQSQATYIPWRENPDWGWTNEIHFFELTNNHWITPVVLGDIPPPCAGFTLTKISNNSAILFGGYQPDCSCINDVYVITVTSCSVTWKKLEMNDGDHPVGRQDHTAVCISSSLTGQDQTVLLIIGGRDSHGHTLKDCWLFNFESITWTQVFLLEQMVHRHFHSAVAIPLTTNNALVILFGGVRDWFWGKSARQQPALDATAILEASFSSSNEWKLKVLMSEMESGPNEDYFELIRQIPIETTNFAEQIVSQDTLQPITAVHDELDISCNPSPLDTVAPVRFYDDDEELKRQLIIAQGRAEEIEEELHQAVMKAEERAVIAEEKSRVAEGKVFLLEAQVKSLELAVKDSKEKVCESYAEVLEYSEQVIHLEKQVLDSESRAINAEISLNEIQSQIERTDKLIKESSLKEAVMKEKTSKIESQVRKIKEDLEDSSSKLKEAKHILLSVQNANLHDLPLDQKAHHFNVAVCYEDNIIVADSMASFITLEAELNKQGTLSKKEIVSISCDIACAIEYIMSHQLCVKYQLNPRSVILVPTQNIEKKWNAKAVIKFGQHSDSIDNNYCQQLSLLLIQMITGVEVGCHDNIDDVLQTVNWPSLIDLIKMCANSNNIQDIILFIKTMDY